MEPDPCFMNTISQEKADAIRKMPEAQVLIRMLSEQNGAVMEQVMKAIRCGEYTKVRQMLQPVMETRQMQDALRNIEKTLG